MKMLIITAGPSYGLIPVLSLELLFRLAGIHVFLILDFSGSIKHLGSYLKNIDMLKGKNNHI
jgi:hypothetical protein